MSIDEKDLEKINKLLIEREEKFKQERKERLKKVNNSLINMCILLLVFALGIGTTYFLLNYAPVSANTQFVSNGATSYQYCKVFVTVYHNSTSAQIADCHVVSNWFNTVGLWQSR